MPNIDIYNIITLTQNNSVHGTTCIFTVVGSGRDLDGGYPCQSLCLVACHEARNNYQKTYTQVSA